MNAASFSLYARAPGKPHSLIPASPLLLPLVPRNMGICVSSERKEQDARVESQLAAVANELAAVMADRQRLELQFHTRLADLEDSVRVREVSMREREDSMREREDSMRERISMVGVGIGQDCTVFVSAGSICLSAKCLATSLGTSEPLNNNNINARYRTF